MRRFVASFLLLMYLFANTELHELAKIRMFLTHFAEHQKEDSALTLFAFIKIHYFNGNLVDADHDKDMQLPFKTSDCNCYNLSHTIPFSEFFLLRPETLFESGKPPLYDQSALPPSHFADIWQPPKAC